MWNVLRHPRAVVGVAGEASIELGQTGEPAPDREGASETGEERAAWASVRKRGMGSGDSGGAGDGAYGKIGRTAQIAGGDGMSDKIPAAL